MKYKVNSSRRISINSGLSIAFQEFLLTSTMCNNFWLSSALSVWTFVHLIMQYNNSSQQKAARFLKSIWPFWGVMHGTSKCQYTEVIWLKKQSIWSKANHLIKLACSRRLVIEDNFNWNETDTCYSERIFAMPWEPFLRKTPLNCENPSVKNVKSRILMMRWTYQQDAA